MTYVKIEDDIFRNPKVVQVSTVAKLVYIASICYSGHHLTDGFIPKNAVRSLSADAGVNYSPKSVGELVDSGLWKETGRGYHIHDYLTYNESAERVRAKKEAARVRMGQRRSGEVPANYPRTSEEVQEPTTTTTSSPNGEDSPLPPKGERKQSGTLSGIQLERFERWYNTYPKKRSRGDAERAWSKIRPSPDDRLVDAMIAKTEEWASSWEWTKEGGQFVPNPATWLNNKRWTDGPPTQQHPRSIDVLPDPDAPIIAGPRGFTPDQLRRLSDQLREKDRRHETA